MAGVRGVANEIEIRTSGEHNDTDIAKAAADSFEWNAALPRGQVMVKVSEGWVTLSGELATNYLRRSAESSVRYLRGSRVSPTSSPSSPMWKPRTSSEDRRINQAARRL